MIGFLISFISVSSFGFIHVCTVFLHFSQEKQFSLSVSSLISSRGLPCLSAGWLRVIKITKALVQ